MNENAPVPVLKKLTAGKPDSRNSQRGRAEVQREAHRPQAVRATAVQGSFLKDTLIPGRFLFISHRKSSLLPLLNS